jgi:hypothetical protein
VVDYVRRWNERTKIPAQQFVGWLGIGQSKFHDWKDRYGKRNEHNAWIPRDWWMADWEKQAIIRFTTMSAYTAPSATWRLRTSWRAARRKSLLPATVSWPRRESAERSNAKRLACGRLPDREKDATMRDDLGGG